MIIEFENQELVAYYDGSHTGKLPFQPSILRQF